MDMLLTFNIVCSLCAMVWPFLLCYSATAATLAISNVTEIAFNSHWYVYPLGLRKCVLLIIARSQKLVYFTGFKLIRCTLITFTKLNNSAISYYIMFKNISKRWKLCLYAQLLIKSLKFDEIIFYMHNSKT